MPENKAHKTTKLEVLLSKMENREIKHFLIYLHRSPAPKSDFKIKIAQAIIEHFEKHKTIQDFPLIWAKVTTEPFIAAKYHNLTSDLAEAALQFITDQVLQAQERLRALATLQIILDREMDILWESELKKAKTLLNTTPYTPEDFLYEYELNRLIYRQSSISLNRKNEVPIPAILSAVANFSILETARYTVELLSFGDVIASDQEIPDPGVLFSAFSDSYRSSHPIIDWYQKLYALYSKDHHLPETQNILHELFEEPNRLSKQELRGMANLIQNRIISACNEGKAGFQELLFHSYQLFLAQGLLVDNNILPPAYYKNYCVSALKVGRVKEAREFTVTHEKFLPPAFHESAKRLNETHILFQERKFAEVLSIVRKELPKEDPFYEYDFRLLEFLALVESDLDDDYLRDFCVPKLLNWLKRQKTIANPHLKSQEIRVIKVRQVVVLKFSEKRNKKAPKKKLKKAIENIEHQGHKKMLLEYLERKCPDPQP